MLRRRGGGRGNIRGGLLLSEGERERELCFFCVFVFLFCVFAFVLEGELWLGWLVGWMFFFCLFF